MSFAVISTTDEYQYQPLDHAKQQIRLVTLLDPREDDDAIRLDIEVFEIEEAPPYTALSYVWGPPSNNAIYIADGRLEIRDNLFKFLTEFRKCRDKTPSDQYLWIDQLCIDQSTTSERNHQVQMMADIYSKATSVIAWLGDGSKRADPSSGIATRECDKFENTYDAACVWKNTGKRAAIAYILHNEYFLRLWIVQEFILARQVRILVKDVWILDGSCQSERRMRSFDKYMRNNLPYSVWNLISKSSLRRDGEYKPLDICAVLDDHGANYCEDPHDKIYGLLGLVALDQRVPVDYEKSIDQLYMDTTLVAIQSRCSDRFQKAEAVDGRVRVGLDQIAAMMGVTTSLQNIHDEFLGCIWNKARLGRFHAHACPITAMGFDRSEKAGCEIERWWFDFQGTRRFLCCLDGKLRSTGPDMQLLLEDWEKYVPGERPKKTSFFTNVGRKHRKRMLHTLLTGADKEEIKK